jgi:ElaB/YqjD/DUF883 family membrane-anchored ribosome-binding protein
MNDRQLENKVRQDAANVKKDLNVLVEDSSNRLGRLDNNISQAAEHLTTWVEDSVSQVSAGVEKLTGEAKETLVSAAAMVKKDVGHGLSQYNQKAQQVANKVPGDFGNQTARHPWVAISIALVLGLLLGSLLRPARNRFAVLNLSISKGEKQ